MFSTLTMKANTDTLHTVNLEQPSGGTQLKIPKLPTRGVKKFTNTSNKETQNRSNVEQKKAKDTARVGGADKRRRVWLPPGSGTSAGQL